MLRPGERGRTGQQRVQRAAEAVDVGADVHRVRVVDLLGCHVIDGAHDLIRLGQLVRHRHVALVQTGQTEIEELGCRLDALVRPLPRTDVSVHSTPHFQMTDEGVHPTVGLVTELSYGLMPPIQ